MRAGGRPALTPLGVHASVWIADRRTQRRVGGARDGRGATFGPSGFQRAGKGASPVPAAVAFHPHDPTPPTGRQPPDTAASRPVAHRRAGDSGWHREVA